MPRASQAGASASRPKCGWRREAGNARTSASTPIACGARIAKKASAERFECPTLKMVPPALMPGPLRLVETDPLQDRRRRHVRGEPLEHDVGVVGGDEEVAVLGADELLVDAALDQLEQRIEVGGDVQHADRL